MIQITGYNDSDPLNDLMLKSSRLVSISFFLKD